MSNPKPKAPTPIIVRNDGPFQRTVDVPETATAPDPYATEPPVRQGKIIDTRRARADWRQEEFQRAILQHGHFLVWYKALICPCQNLTTNQAEINCVKCDGSGFFFTDPLQIRGIMTSMERNQRIFEKFGAWVEGTSNLTVEPQYRVHYGDRIEMIDAVMPHSELFTKNERRGARSVLPAHTDSVRYRITRLSTLLWQNDADETIALEQGNHFEVTPEGWIHWLDEGQKLVPDGATLSVLFEYHPTYLVVSHPHATRMEVLEHMLPEKRAFAPPTQSMVKLDYLITDLNQPPPSMSTIVAASTPGPF